jgi:transcriptional regulator with XRE-family HTH domain
LAQKLVDDLVAFLVVLIRHRRFLLLERIGEREKTKACPEIVRTNKGDSVYASESGDTNGTAEEEEAVDLNSMVGARIKELRDIRGITQNEMGRMLGHTDVYVSQIETGKRRIGLDLLEKIAVALDVSPLVFFKGVWQGEDASDQISSLTRRTEQLRSTVEDLLAAVKSLSEQRRVAAEPDPTTAAIAAASQALDPPVRQLLLEIANAIHANPSVLSRPGAISSNGEGS